MQPPEDYPENSYLDVVDGQARVSWLEKHDDIGVIACSTAGEEYLEKKLGRKVMLIPQHHCNYERVRRNRDEIKVVGLIGNSITLDVWPGLPDALKEIGLKFKYEGDYNNRQDVVNFYKTIDIQVVWRPFHRWLKNPLKIVNAGSFGIPTVAFPEVGYKEMTEYYLAAESCHKAIKKIKLLKNKRHYAKWPEKLIRKTEQYHIDNISKLYVKILEE